MEKTEGHYGAQIVIHSLASPLKSAKLLQVSASRKYRVRLRAVFKPTYQHHTEGCRQG
jgi:hypothetical protein